MTAGAHCTTAVTSSDSGSLSTSPGTSIMPPGERRPLIAAPRLAAIRPAPAPPVPPDELSEAGAGPIWGSQEDMDLIQWDLERKLQPGGCRLQPPTLPIPAPRPGGQPGQSAGTGYTARHPDASSRPGFPIISPPHQNQQHKAPPVPEPGNQLAALTAAMEQLRQVNLQQQIDMRAMRDQIVTLTARPTYAQSECDIGLGPEHQCFEELNGFPRFRGRVSPAGSQMSTASTSRFPSTVHKHLHNIKRTVEALSHLEGQGSKQISANLVELRQNRKELDAAMTAADVEGDFPKIVRFEVEDILEKAPALKLKQPSGRMIWRLRRRRKEWTYNRGLVSVLVSSRESQNILIFS